MDEILDLNSMYFSQHENVEVNLISVEKIIKLLSKHSIVKVMWLYHSEKTATVYKAVKMMWELQNCFYFNSQIFKNSRVKSAKWILKLLEHSSEKKAFDATSILIFESIEDIKHAKDAITELFQKKRYKIILIWSLRHLQGLPEVLVKETSVQKKIDLKNDSQNLNNYFQLWSLHDFDYDVGGDKQQIQIRDMLKDSCILQDIIMSYGVKDVFLFQATLNFLSRNIWEYVSLRDITKLLNDGNLKTSVITITDYVANACSVWLIHKVKKYDFKKDKKMDSKGSYYFWDLGILASIKKDTATPKQRLLENLLYLELLNLWYTICSWINGKFNFSFYVKKLGEEKCIHVSAQTDKKEIRKEINKLMKIKGKSERYLVLESLEELGLRKKDYQEVKLINIIDMLQVI